jgi:hypothetical protein
MAVDQQANGHAASGGGDSDHGHHWHDDHDDSPYIVFGYGSLIFRVRSSSITFAIAIAIATGSSGTGLCTPRLANETTVCPLMDRDWWGRMCDDLLASTSRRQKQ